MYFALGEGLKYHNTLRPHQGLGNVPIPERDKELKFQDSTEPIGKIDCQQWLGGLIKSYPVKRRGSTGLAKFFLGLFGHGFLQPAAGYGSTML